MREPTYFIGVDVQAKRGCPYAVLNASGEFVEADWLQGTGSTELAKALRAVVNRHNKAQPDRVAVGIDAPRKRLNSPRNCYWDGKKHRWRPRHSETGNGRHCDVVIAAHRLANPQWTPHSPPIPAWMELGFALFDALDDGAQVYEVFPTASYNLLENDASLRIGLRFKGFARGPKDMLDAYVAAATVREFAQGRGASVGGGDGFGEIILPRPLSKPIAEVLDWPHEL